MSEQCPKCGSDKILDGQCLSCGIVVSKYDPSRGAPVSFVAAQLQQAPGNLNAADTAARYAQLQRESRRKFRIVLSLALLGVLLAGYSGYRVLLRRASAIQGLHKDGKNLFHVQFPDSGWFQYLESDRKSLPLRNVVDAFHTGESPREPDAILGVWIEFIDRPLQTRVSADRPRTRRIAEEQFVKRMEDSGFETSLDLIHDIDFGYVGEATSTKDGKAWPTFTAFGINGNRSYLLIALGPEGKVEKHEEEIRKILKSLGFGMSII